MPHPIPTPRRPWQSTRTLTVESPAIPKHLGEPVLQALRLEGDEGVNSLFEYRLTLRTLADFRAVDHGAAGWDLNGFIDQPVSCRIQIDNSSVDYFKYPGHAGTGIGNGTAPVVREINGIVTAAEFLGDEGDQAQYRLTLRPGLFKGTLSANCRIFQNMTAVDILREVAGLHQSDMAFHVSSEVPLRDYQTQYNETDFAFFERLCQEWGINYYFIHEKGRHTLQLTDLDTFLVTPGEPYQCVQYHAPGWKADAEYLHHVRLGHHLAMSRYESGEHDYTTPDAPLATGSLNQRVERKASGLFYAWHGGPAASHYAQPQAGGPRLMGRQVLSRGVLDTIAQGNLLARRRIEAFNTAGRRLHAAGNLRGMVPGCLFTLAGHPRTQANARYLVIESHFLLEEVAQESRRATGPAQQWRVHVELTGHPSQDELRPTPTRSKPHTHGPQSAVVTGPEGHAVWTDGYGRIQVRFRWDRSELRGTDFGTSCWIRVASSWAGAFMGAISVPRVGQEVLIDFIGGDPDLPVCVQSLYNHNKPTPWNLPGEQALSGIRSRELPEPGTSFMGRHNHLVFDDTHRKIQVQLRSDHLHSQLSLGFVRRIETEKGRQDPRGEGFELRTDGHGVLRAGAGMLVSSQARKAAGGGMKELEETARMLAGAQTQVEAHGRGATDLGAQDAGDQSAVAAALASQNRAIAGASAKALGELEAPHLVLASPAGVAAAAGHDIQLVAGENIALTSAAHTSISTGASLLASAARAIRLMAHRGMRMFAAHGDLEVRALDADLRLSAKNTAELASTDGWVNVTAREGIRLNVGGTCIEITAAQIALLTCGRISLHSAGYDASGPSNRAEQLNRMAKTGFDDRYRLRDPLGAVLGQRAWRAVREDGSEMSGISDAEGFIDIQRSDGPHGWTFLPT